MLRTPNSTATTQSSQLGRPTHNQLALQFDSVVPRLRYKTGFSVGRLFTAYTFSLWISNQGRLEEAEVHAVSCKAGAAHLHEKQSPVLSSMPLCTRAFYGHVTLQNIDGLHERAGSTGVINLHGSLWRTRCTHCARREDNRSMPICPALAGKVSLAEKENTWCRLNRFTRLLRVCYLLWAFTPNRRFRVESFAPVQGIFGFARIRSLRMSD
jgi:hypothetical protein